MFRKQLEPEQVTGGNRSHGSSGTAGAFFDWRHMMNKQKDKAGKTGRSHSYKKPSCHKEKIPQTARKILHAVTKTPTQPKINKYIDIYSGNTTLC